MGQVYPKGMIEQTISNQRSTRPAIRPGIQVPGTQTWEYPGPPPAPANDNFPPGKPPPKKPRPIRRPNIRGLIGLSRWPIIWGAVGIVPGFETVPAPVVGTGGFISWCLKPNGYGPAQPSVTPYFPQGTLPSSPQVQPNSCIDLQALPGGNDGVPDAPSQRRLWDEVGIYRYTNNFATRYTHMRSWKRAGMFNVSQSKIPGVRSGGHTLPSTKLPRPPRAKERKFIFRGPLRLAVDFASEVGDFIECLWQGLPGSAKRAAYAAKGSRLGKADKARAAYDGFHSIDWGSVAACVYANEVEDRFLGKLGRFTRDANRKRGRLTGVAVGPAI